MTPVEREGREYVRYDNPGDRSLEWGRDTVTKTGPRDVMALEVTKTRMAAEIGAATGLFAVPAILDYDDSAGRIVFERVPHVTPCGYLEQRMERWPHLPEPLAAIIATVHARLSLPEHLRSPLPEEFQCTGAPRVVVHGDFTGRNVLIREDCGAIVLTDWTTTYRLGETATVGPGWFDVAWFVRWQYLRLGFRGIPAAAQDACARLVRSYMDQTSGNMTGGFADYLMKVTLADRKRRDVCFSMKRRLAAWRGDVALLRFARRLRVAGPHGP